MSSMKQTKEGVNLKKLLRLKNTGSIFVIAGLLIIFVIALYTFILQSSYTKTALETEIKRDTASADAVHKLVAVSYTHLSAASFSSSMTKA